MDPIGLSEIKKAAMHLRAIDNPLRLKILDAIRENNNRVAVSELYKKMQLVQSVASGQLAILRKSLIVTISREGKFIYYSVNQERIDQILRLSQLLNNSDD